LPERFKVGWESKQLHSPLDFAHDNYAEYHVTSPSFLALAEV